MAAFSDSIAVVVPVYNHPQRLREVVERCLATHPHVVVVDDGSREDPAPLLEGLAVTLLRHETNRGKGAAMRTAALHAASQGKTHIITVDADGQHFPEDIPKIIDAIADHPDDIIIGVRQFEGSGAPGASRFGRSFGNFWVRVQTGADVGDIQSGFRAYPVEVLREIPTFTRRYAFEVEIVVRALWAGRTVRTVPVRVHYPPGGERISHFKGLRENLVLSLLNTHLTIRSILPWPHRKLPPGARRIEGVSLRSFLRSAKRLFTQSAHPGEVARATALGLFLGALPLIAVHTIVILHAAAYLRLNKAIAVGASQFCMPPLVPALCILTGYLMRHGQFVTLQDIRSASAASFLELGYMGAERLWEWILGSLVVAPVIAIAGGGLVYLFAMLFRRMVHS